MESYTEKIVPVEMETSGIRSEVRLLAEQMKLGFEKMHEEMDLRFQKMDQKMDFIRENLEKQISFQQKLLWGILGVVIATLFKKYLGLE